MKKLSTFIFCLLSLGTLVAQFQLDVEGDAKIRGRLDLKAASGSLFIGENAGLNDNGGINDNVFVGKNAGNANIDGIHNTFVGNSAGSKNTSGKFNAFFGLNSGFNNTDGRANAFFGTSSGSSNTSGKLNAFFGLNSGFLNIDGSSNAFFGHSAGGNNTSGSYNAFFGLGAGNTENNSRSTLLGAFANVATDSLDRAIAIGYDAKVACHNCAVIGGIGDNAVKVGIGTSAPLNQMHIIQSNESDIRKGIRLELPDGTKSWTTFGDVNGRYNITYNGSYLAYLDNNSGMWQSAVNPFTSQDDSSKSRNRNSQSMDNVLDKVKKLQPTTKKLNNSRNARKIWGFVTAEVAALFPEITPEIDGRKGIIYDYFGILSIKAIQELAVTMETQEKVVVIQNETISILEEKAATQQSQINELKSLVETLLTQNAETPKSTSYVLPLEQQALLAQNQPNPFRENTLVDYFVPAEVQHAHIQVTGLDGQVLGQVSISKKGKGQVTIQSKSYPAGTYFYSLVLDGQVMETKRMVLAR